MSAVNWNAECPTEVDRVYPGAVRADCAKLEVTTVASELEELL